MRLKHNKKRNTALLYEVLVRELTISGLEKDAQKRNAVISLIKEFFIFDTEIKKELSLYKTLLETKNLPLRLAEKLLYEVKIAHKNLNKKQLFKEQSQLIKIINKNLSKETYSIFVPNYKNLATISQIFSEDVSVKSRVLLEENIVQKLAINKGTKEENEKQITNLVLQNFINKYNTSYSFLMSEQKELLNKYVLSFLDNGVEFKFYLNEEITRIKENIKKSLRMEDIKKDTKIKEKVEKVLNLLENFAKNPISEETLKHILKMQVLVSEIQQ
tara:strand:- start:1411 stop:2229 length:819 start_codon:yes stop_codon:yes gene_type:complete